MSRTYIRKRWDYQLGQPISYAQHMAKYNSLPWEKRKARWASLLLVKATPAYRWFNGWIVTLTWAMCRYAKDYDENEIFDWFMKLPRVDFASV